MSFDSRLLRPRRSNSSSASSALVSVGVSSVGCRLRGAGGSVGWPWSSMLRSLGPQADAEPRLERGEHAGDDALDALVGQRLARRRAARGAAPGCARRRRCRAPASSACRCRTGSRRGRRRRRPPRPPPAAPRGVTLFLATTARSRHAGCCFGSGSKLGTGRRISASASSSNTTGVAGQLVGLAPARMQLADEADAHAVDLDRGAAARDAAPDALPARSVGRTRPNSASRSPLTSKKSTARSASPHCSGIAGPKARPPSRSGWRGRPRRRRRPARSASRR